MAEVDTNAIIAAGEPPDQYLQAYHYAKRELGLEEARLLAMFAAAISADPWDELMMFMPDGLLRCAWLVLAAMPEDHEVPPVFRTVSEAVDAVVAPALSAS